MLQIPREIDGRPFFPFRKKIKKIPECNHLVSNPNQARKGSESGAIYGAICSNLSYIKNMYLGKRAEDVQPFDEGPNTLFPNNPSFKTKTGH